MKEELEAQISTEWRKSEGTGELCEMCGEAVWLQEFRLIAKIHIGKVTRETRTRFVVCVACGDVLV